MTYIFASQATYTCASVTKQHDLVAANRGDLFGWKSNRGPGGKERQPTTGFMTNVTCRLTAKKPGSAPCPTLVIEYRTCDAAMLARSWET